MGFYDAIAAYYDKIFPVGSSQLAFIKESTGSAPARMLDVACGTGGYSIELAREGYQVFASDLDEEMVRLARNKAAAAGVEAEFEVCDMRALGTSFSGLFRCVFCIGNSIVHLGSLNQISSTIKDMYSLLEPGGVLVLQTVNYDRIMKHGITSLPSIKADDGTIEFIRNYRYENGADHVEFDTVLTINEGQERKSYENSVSLLALQSRELLDILRNTGFERVEVFGGFDKVPFDENAFLTVTRAYK